MDGDDKSKRRTMKNVPCKVWVKEEKPSSKTGI